MLATLPMSRDTERVMSQENVPDVGFLDAFGERFGAAWNSHEPDRLLELMTDDVVYDDSAWPRTMRDHSQVREFLEFLWRAFPISSSKTWRARSWLARRRRLFTTGEAPAHSQGR